MVITPLDPLVAKPVRTPAPAIVIVPSIFGVNDESRRWLAHYSAAGFITLLYDPFWRTAPGALSVTDPQDRVKAAARRDAFDVEEGVRDLAGLIARARAMPECNGNVAVVGYCFGGRYAMIAAASLDVQAAVSFHGITMGKSLDAAAAIKVPASFHFGDQDHSTPMSEVEDIRAAAADNPLVDISLYEGAGHSFTWHGHTLYDPKADALSMERALRVLSALF